jgi:hypothetical protein
MNNCGCRFAPSFLELTTSSKVRIHHAEPDPASRIYLNFLIPATGSSPAQAPPERHHNSVSGFMTNHHNFKIDRIP